MQTDRWSLPALFREATRNVFVPRSKLLFVVAIAIAAGTAMSLILATEANTFRATLIALDAQGRNLVTLQSASQEAPTKISRASCENLTGTTGVTRAGLVMPGDSTTVIQLGRIAPIAQASSTLFPQLRTHQALIGSALNGPQAGGLITTDRGVFTALPADPQPEGLNTNSGLVFPLPPAVTAGDACFAVLEPYADAGRTIPLLAAQLEARGGAVFGAETTKQTLDPIALYLDRLTRYLPLLIGLAGALVASLGNRLRAGELAVYRLSGTSARSLAMILVLEQLIISGIGLSAASVTLAVTARYLVSVSASFAWVTAGFILWAAVAGTFALPIAYRSALSLAKDR